MPNLRYTTGLNRIALAETMKTCGSMIANFDSEELAAIEFPGEERVNENRSFLVRATGKKIPPMTN
jgi:archaellum component FlaG (FlaF/FlaG flagellin family)